KRPSFDSSSLEETVKNILDEVKANGDEAVRKFTLQFDKIDISELQVNDAEIEAAGTSLSADLKQAIVTAKNNIEKFHRSQLTEAGFVETMPGVRCWRKSVPIEKVGLYIPGGSAPLFSTLIMLAVPAKIAGCKEIIVCTPPQKNGNVHPAVLYAAKQTGINKVYKIGGAQAVAAM